MTTRAALCGLLFALTGCGEDARPLPPLPMGMGGEAGASGGAAGAPESGGAAGTGAASGSGGAGSGGAPVGSLEVVDVPDEPCTATTALPVTVMEPEPLGIVFERAGAIGDRRFAFDSASLAFMTFDSDGSAPSPLVLRDVAALVAHGEGLLALEIDAGGELVATSFDALAVPVGESVKLDGTFTESHALASSPGLALAVWGVEGELRGRLLPADGAPGDLLSFGSQSCGEYGCKPVTLWNGHHFIVIWSRVLNGGMVRASWAAVAENGTIVSTKTLFTDVVFHQIIDAALLPDEGIAVLISEDFPSAAPLLLFTDAFGNGRMPAYRFLGAPEPWGVASHGSDLALVARSDEEQAVFRPLSAAGTPLGAWVCLDDSGPNTNFYPRAAIHSTSSGYGLVVRRTDGSATYLSTNPLGSALTD
jgi:hypothetical protein